jgi:hypothetical protein
MQRHAFGQAGLSGVKKAMEKRGKTLAVEASFPRNTVDIQPALAKIQAANPGAVVMVGPYGPRGFYLEEIGMVGLALAALLTLITGYDYLRAGLSYMDRPKQEA